VVGGQKYASGTDRIAGHNLLPMSDILTRNRRVAEAGEDMQLNRRFIQFRGTLSGVNTNRTE
jgi:hypothetical protein